MIMMTRITPATADTTTPEIMRTVSFDSECWQQWLVGGSSIIVAIVIIILIIVITSYTFEFVTMYLL